MLENGEKDLKVPEISFLATAGGEHWSGCHCFILIYTWILCKVSSLTAYVPQPVFVFTSGSNDSMLPVLMSAIFFQLSKCAAKFGHTQKSHTYVLDSHGVCNEEIQFLLLHFY